MLLEALSTARDLGRLHEIASVFIRHGLGDFVRRLGLAGAVERAGRALHWEGAEGLADKDPAQHVREALEDLGPTFVKIGQILAGRNDLLPVEWTREFSRLQQHVLPSDEAAVRDQLMEDLGGSPEEIFDDFQIQPLAAASIAQVHRAKLKDGTPVALKVRRPGIRETVEADLRLLRRLAEVAEREMPELARYQPTLLARQLERSLREELDLSREARSAQRIAANLDPGLRIRIPRIHADYTCERLCVMELFEGTTLGDALDGRHSPSTDDPFANHDRRELARLGTRAILKMVLVDGYFHADPHAGNMILLEEGQLGLIDFGMIGRLSEERRNEFIDMLAAFVDGDVQDIVHVLGEWAPQGRLDYDSLTQDCSAMLERYRELSLAELNLGQLLADISSLLRDNDLFLPGDFALLFKVFCTLESLGERLDADFMLATEVEPFARDLSEKRRSPKSLLRFGAREFRRFFSHLPADLRHFSRMARRGQLRVQIEVEELDRLTGRFESSVNRLTIGLVTSALIVGTSIALTVSAGPKIWGFSAFGFLGFTSSIAIGAGLLISMVRGSHRK